MYTYLRTCTTQRLTVQYWIEGHWVFNIYCFVKQIKSGSKSKTQQKKRKLCVFAQIFEMPFLKFERHIYLTNNLFLKLRNWMFRKLYDGDGCYNLHIYTGIIVYLIAGYCVYLLQHSLFAFIAMWLTKNILMEKKVQKTWILLLQLPEDQINNKYLSNFWNITYKSALNHSYISQVL